MKYRAPVKLSSLYPSPLFNVKGMKSVLCLPTLRLILFNEVALNCWCAFLSRSIDAHFDNFR